MKFCTGKQGKFISSANNTHLNFLKSSLIRNFKLILIKTNCNKIYSKNCFIKAISNKLFFSQVILFFLLQIKLYRKNKFKKHSEKRHECKILNFKSFWPFFFPSTCLIREVNRENFAYTPKCNKLNSKCKNNRFGTVQRSRRANEIQMTNIKQN